MFCVCVIIIDKFDVDITDICELSVKVNCFVSVIDIIMISDGYGLY